MIEIMKFMAMVAVQYLTVAFCLWDIQWGNKAHFWIKLLIVVVAIANSTPRREK